MLIVACVLIVCVLGVSYVYSRHVRRFADQRVNEAENRANLPIGSPPSFFRNDRRRRSSLSTRSQKIIQQQPPIYVPIPMSRATNYNETTLNSDPVHYEQLPPDDIIVSTEKLYDSPGDELIV